ncbi:3-oxoacyl-[acyl-carrier-protein] reductase-like protein [Emericellopsis cladophorae]|uniref:3-oxoacyl-[acyl-carrier-protein] reductase-like protein n=1 Tax=Emericellopsis cladophorae TaxID=2686198 RepID=A0A9Q0BEI9_9HYPO|nr:3-oxoacyl-[acyl-carrier-protein] reductase-like protein [Emericellopsis cladophorae]KAI6781279.1 3-oxoacyl-[acyl-carrier-protein] reductase-like protein [Emericellopsis cladophorae]
MASLLRGSAFITGAASGIGQYTAMAFARHGVTRLAIADINASNLEATRATLASTFPQVQILPLHMDVRSKIQVNEGIAQVAKEFGRLDIAVNNAGINGSGRLTHETEDEEIERVLDVNLHGVYRCQKAELAAMVKQEDLGPRDGRGRIINIASMYGLVAPNSRLSHTSYTTAKHGVVGLTRGDANAYADYNIRVNAIAPGYIETPLVEAAMAMTAGTPLMDDLARAPMRRIGSMEEIADSIVCLASRMNSYQTGAVTVVDGGFTSN